MVGNRQTFYMSSLQGGCGKSLNDDMGVYAAERRHHNKPVRMPSNLGNIFVQSPAKSLSENCHEWFDKLPEESGSEDIPHKESDTTNGQSSVRPVRLPGLYIAGLSDSSICISSESDPSDRRCGEHYRRTVKRQIKVVG